MLVAAFSGGHAPRRLPDLPKRVRTALARALSRDPRARFPSCAAFADELRACAAELSGAVGPDDVAALMERLFPGEQARRRARHTALLRN